MSYPVPLCCPAVNSSMTTYLVRLLFTYMLIFAIYMCIVLNIDYICICNVYYIYLYSSLKQIVKRCNLCFFRPLSAFIAYRLKEDIL